MKLKINLDMLKFLYKNQKDIKYNKDLQDIAKQMGEEIKNDENLCYLISGYRGCGKTTFINYLEDKIKDENIFFIRLNLSKSEDYNIIIRRLIRQISLIINESGKIKEEELINRLQLLYINTFYDVSNTLTIKECSEQQVSIEAKSKLSDFIKKIIEAILIIFAGLNIHINFFDNSLFTRSFLFCVIVLVCGFFNIDFKYKVTKGSIGKYDMKSLYDDEIAEYRLIDLLEELQNKGFKVVFVFDELDKLTIEEQKKIISQIKPLLLSKLASFIIISGQGLYYELSRADAVDDSILSSIFTKHIHVPLFEKDEFYEIFESFCSEKLDRNNDLINDYINSLILESNKVIRRFINLILKNVHWNNNEPYLVINEAYLKSNKLDTIILECLYNIFNDNIDLTHMDYMVKDFYEYQILLLIKRMKQYGYDYFTIEDIIDCNKEITEIYPYGYEYYITNLIKDLMNEFIEKKVVNKKEESNSNIQYKFNDEVEFNIYGMLNKKTRLKLSFIQRGIELEKVVRYIAIDIEPNKKRYGLSSNLSFVYGKGIIDESIKNNVMQIIVMLNKVRHGEEIDNSELEKLSEYESKLTIYRFKIITEYCGYILRKNEKKYKYCLESKNKSDLDWQFDFHMKDLDNKFECFVDIKINIKSLRKLNLKDMITFVTSKKIDNFRIIILCFCEKIGVEEDELSLINETVIKEFPRLKDNLIIKVIGINEEEFNISNIEKNCIESMIMSTINFG